MNKGKYIGDVKDGKCHGFGKMTSATGNVWQGEWEDGILKTPFIYSPSWWKRLRGSIGRYKGGILNGMCHGLGKMSNADGDTWKGEWKDGKLNCYATFLYPTYARGSNALRWGESYEGEWKDGVYHGQGKHKLFGTNTTSEGQWKNGKLHGFASMSSREINGNTRIFEGKWVDGTLHGYGVIIRRVGGSTSTVKGKLVDGSLHGKAIETITEGENWEKSEGVYEDGFKSGGAIVTNSDGERFEGTWVPPSRSLRGLLGGHKLEPHGTYVNADGDRYEGEWIDEMLTGHGTITYANGNIYEGEWKKYKRHGKGTYTYFGGRVVKGLWNYDEFFKQEDNEEKIIKGDKGTPRIITTAVGTRTTDRLPGTRGHGPWAC